MAEKIVERPELNMNNYDETDVAHLEAWAIDAEERLDKQRDRIHCLENALRNIIRHQELAGGSMAQKSTTVEIAKHVLNHA